MSADAAAVRAIVSLVARFIDLVIGINRNFEGTVGTEAVCGHLEQDQPTRLGTHLLSPSP
jgi:hypothetical protein